MKFLGTLLVRAAFVVLFSIQPVRGSTTATANHEALDLAPFGYAFFADRAVGANPPETQWLVSGASNVIAGVMWEEHRPVNRVELEFAGLAPEASQLILEVTTSTPTEKQDNRPTWWTRAFEAFPGMGNRSTDGRRIIFNTSRDEIIRRLAKYPPGFRYEADPQGLLFIDKIRVRQLGTDKTARITALHACGVAGTAPMRIAIEWGFQPAPKQEQLEGRIEVYNGRLGPIKPISGSQGVLISHPDAWKPALANGSPKGIETDALYVPDDTQEVVFQPAIDLPAGSNGRLTWRPNRTVITLRTSSGSFSFAPKDLEGGKPIYLPSLGFVIYQAGNREAAMDHIRQFTLSQAGTIRQRVRAMPEQSLERALSDQYGASRPALPVSEAEPPMSIEVPDKLAVAAWKLAFWHVQRRCVQENGVYQFYIWPYKALLGQESWRLFYALDLLGQHAIPQSGFEPWFKAQGTMTARGMFTDKAGALNVSGWDLNHAQGHGSMLFAMAEHYLLAGDKAWLTSHRTHLIDACEWIERQRREWTKTAGPDSWSAGLVPPCEMGDYADWRSLYQTSLFYWKGLLSAAEALGDIEPETGARLLRQAAEFRLAIQRAADRSIIQTPVVRVSDGSSRRFIPPQPYLRGLCDQITNPFGGAHAGSLVMDGDLGTASLGLGVLAGSDPMMDEMLDVLEDVIYHDNWMVQKHRQDRMPGRTNSWFTIGGYYYQCGYSQSALAHLFRDDVPNYLRSTFNQYAADVDPYKGYQFREHPNRTGEGNGGDKTFEAAAFLERMRAMFVMEDNDTLWLARATPREWLQPGKRIAVRNAPSLFGDVSYEIVSGEKTNSITATIDLPSRRLSHSVILRLRHPQATPLRKVMVNGTAWEQFDKNKEIIRLNNLKGRVILEAFY